jgi:hypothetical protein
MVRAALECPFCLDAPAHVLVNNGAKCADAVCACARCHLQWSLSLNADQARRLRHDPPRTLCADPREAGGLTGEAS